MSEAHCIFDCVGVCMNVLSFVYWPVVRVVSDLTYEVMSGTLCILVQYTMCCVYMSVCLCVCVC